jgi:hypothetical protein
MVPVLDEYIIANSRTGNGMPATWLKSLIERAFRSHLAVTGPYRS